MAVCSRKLHTTAYKNQTTENIITWSKKSDLNIASNLTKRAAEMRINCHVIKMKFPINHHTEPLGKRY